MPLSPRQEAIRAAGRTRGWHTDAALATGLGLDQSHVHRVLRGQTRPGDRFIAACLREFGGLKAFPGLFDLEDEDVHEPVAS